MKTAYWGLFGFLGFSVAWMGGAAFLWSGSRTPMSNDTMHGAAKAARPPVQDVDPAAHATHRISPPQAADMRLQRLVERLVELLGRAGLGDEDELERIEQDLLALGEQVAEPIVLRIQSERDSARRELLLNFLRKIPGGAAELYLIEEARAGNTGSSRTLAIDALAERRTDATLAALDQIAKSDPDSPSRPFLSAPRKPGDDSTELPDEVTFTPRMKAMAALASTRDARAALTLSDVLRDERDESLRMEAARNLAQLRADPAVIDALLACLGSDRSAYVRLAALHSLEGVIDARLPGSLTRLAVHDPDRGVQALARRLLAQLASAG